MNAQSVQAQRIPGNPIAALFGKRELWWQFVVRNVELRHRGSHLGLVWSILNPLLMLGIYVFMFGFVFGGSFRAIPDETRWDYALGILLGLNMYHLLSDVIVSSPMIIVSQPNFVKKVVFPLEILPAAAVGASTIHFLISMGLLIVGVATVGPGFASTIAWLPVVALPLVLLATGLAWFVSALGVFVRDIGQVVAALALVLMFASAIFYPVSDMENNAPLAWAILKFNPLLIAVDIGRAVTLWHQPPDVDRIVFLYATGIVAFFGGYFVFGRLRTGFADVL